jgi:hypothetical protein
MSGLRIMPNRPGKPAGMVATASVLAPNPARVAGGHTGAVTKSLTSKMDRLSVGAPAPGGAAGAPAGGAGAATVGGPIEPATFNPWSRGGYRKHRKSHRKSHKGSRKAHHKGSRKSKSHRKSHKRSKSQRRH